MQTLSFEETGVYHLNALLNQASLADIRTQLRHQLHDTPEKMHLRWRLFQILCLQSDWKGALKQLQTCAAFEFITEKTAQALRCLIQAEQQRLALFAGQYTAVWYQGHCPEWAHDFLTALSLSATQTPESLADADMLRMEAIKKIPDIKGLANNHAFTWISDSDTRLGPVIELIMSGQLQLVSFDQIQHMQCQAPTGVLDLIWTPVKVTFRDGLTVECYTPTRYVVSQETSEPAKLSRITEWETINDTLVIGHGQKVWLTSQGDMNVCDLRHLDIHPLT